jgi:hypothetical protein
MPSLTSLSVSELTLSQAQEDYGFILLDPFFSPTFFHLAVEQVQWKITGHFFCKSIHFFSPPSIPIFYRSE